MDVFTDECSRGVQVMSGVFANAAHEERAMDGALTAVAGLQPEQRTVLDAFASHRLKGKTYRLAVGRQALSSLSRETRNSLH